MKKRKSKIMGETIDCDFGVDTSVESPPVSEVQRMFEEAVEERVKELREYMADVAERVASALRQANKRKGNHGKKD